VALPVQILLERNELFRGLPPTMIRTVAGLALRRSYRSGAQVFAQGEPGDALYGVITGEIRISSSARDGKEVFLNVLRPGDTFGEIALLDGKNRTATASTTAPTELVVIKREAFLALLKREPTLSIYLIQLLCERVRWASGWAEDSALLSVPERLARRLLSLAKRQGHETEHGVQLIISQEEIARFLGLSRQVINQYLQTWKVKGWVNLGRGKMIIVDDKAMQKVAAGT
jgi:CRP/FNR family cyclic AMP-dependent transcriptional regulator